MFPDDKNNDYYSICENKLLRLFDSYRMMRI